MSTLTLRLSKARLQSLEKNAKKFGKTVEEYILDLIEIMEKEKFDVTQDAIYNIKARDSSAPVDLASNHDHYLYGSNH